MVFPPPTASESHTPTRINSKDWSFPFIPRDEWQQMFTEAWRMERDYFYDRKMHSLDWPALLKNTSPWSIG